jgi:hypothetical protein
MLLKDFYKLEKSDKLLQDQRRLINTRLQKS